MFHKVLSIKLIIILVLCVCTANGQYHTASQGGTYSGQSGYYPTQTGQFSGQPTYNPYKPISQYPTQSSGSTYSGPQTSYQQPSSYTSATEQSGSTANANSRTLGLLGGGLLGRLLGGGGGRGGLLSNLFGLGGNRNPVASGYPVPVPAPVYGAYPGSFVGYSVGYPGGFGGYPAYGSFNGYYG